MKTIMNRLDLFGPQVQLELQNSNKTGTKLGFMVSCFIYFCTLLALLFLCIEYFDLSYPQQIEWHETSIDPQENQLPAILIGFGITQKNGMFFKNDNMTKKAFNMVSENCLKTPLGKQCVQYDVARCSEAELLPYLEHLLGEQLLQQIFCVNFRQQMERNITFQGQFYSPYYSYFTVSITRCSKEEDPICLDDDEIDEILEDAFLGYITFSYDYTVKNFKNPGKLTGKTYQSFITPDTYSKFQIFYSQAELTTYFNILSLFDLSTNFRVLDLARTNTIMLPHIKDKKKIAEIVLQLSDQIDLYQRFYQSRVLEIISSSLGLFFILYVVFHHILLYYQRLTYQLIIGKSIEDYKQQNKEITENKQIKPNKELKEQHINQHQVSPINLENQEANLNLVFDKGKQENELYQNQQENKKLFDFDVTNIFQVHKNLKDKKLRDKLDQIQQKIDIVQLLNQSEEFDLLKNLLLTESQLYIFNFIKDQKGQVTEQLQIHYQQLEQEQQNQVNQRLLQMMDQQIKIKLSKYKDQEKQGNQFNFYQLSRDEQSQVRMSSQTNQKNITIINNFHIQIQFYLKMMEDSYRLGQQSRVEAGLEFSEPKQNVMHDISMYENSYNSRVIYSRKLYFMLLIQMIVIGNLSIFLYTFTGIITLLVHTQPSVDQFLEQNPWIFWVALVSAVGVATITLMFRESCRKKPQNWIVFIIFTISAALVCGYLVAIGDSLIGLCVFFSMSSVIFFLFLYSLTVKKRLTYQGSTLFISASILLIFEMFTIFSNISLFWLIVVSLVAFLLAYFLIYDTQTSVKQLKIKLNNLISSGDRYDVTLEDEVSGSVVVYWDIILLFLKTAELIKDFMIRERN